MKTEVKTKEEMKTKTMKITNPLWVGHIGPNIADFCNKVKVPGLLYETLYSYFCQSVQVGGNNSELWVGFEDEQPKAFAHWFIMGLPYSGKVNLDYIYSWTKNKDISRSLVKEFINFSVKSRALILSGTFVKEKLFDYFQKIAKEEGYDMTKTGYCNFNCTKEGS